MLLYRACSSNAGRVNHVVAMNNRVARDVFVDEDLVDTDDEGGSSENDDGGEYDDFDDVGEGFLYGDGRDSDLGGSDDEQEQNHDAREPMPPLEGGEGEGNNSHRRWLMHGDWCVGVE